MQIQEYLKDLICVNLVTLNSEARRLPMKIQLIQGGFPIYPEEAGVLYEYLFKFQKLWEDNLFQPISINI